MNLKENKENYLPYQTSIEHQKIFWFFFSQENIVKKKSYKIPMNLKGNKGNYLLQ